MKSFLALLTLCLLTHRAAAQESIPTDEARKIARVLIMAAGDIPNAQLKAELDPEQPRGIKAGDAGLIVIPAAKLTAAAVAKAGKEPVALGQLWLHKLAPAQDGSPVALAKLRTITVTDKDKSADAQLYFLGVRDAGAGKLELVVYALDKQPLLRVPLEIAEASQDSPIELQGRKSGEDAGVLTVNLLGKYKAELTLMKPAQ